MSAPSDPCAPTICRPLPPLTSTTFNQTAEPCAGFADVADVHLQPVFHSRSILLHRMWVRTKIVPPLVTTLCLGYPAPAETRYVESLRIDLDLTRTP